MILITSSDGSGDYRPWNAYKALVRFPTQADRLSAFSLPWVLRCQCARVIRIVIKLSFTRYSGVRACSAVSAVMAVHAPSSYGSWVTVPSRKASRHRAQISLDGTVTAHSYGSCINGKRRRRAALALNAEKYPEMGQPKHTTIYNILRRYLILHGGTSQIGSGFRIEHVLEPIRH